MGPSVGQGQSSLESQPSSDPGCHKGRSLVPTLSPWVILEPQFPNPLDSKSEGKAVTIYTINQGLS